MTSAGSSTLCLRPTVTALAIGNLGTWGDAASSPPLPPGERRGDGARNHAQPRSRDTCRITWAKSSSLGSPNTSRSRARGVAATSAWSRSSSDPAPIRKILLHPGEPPVSPPLASARGPPTSWAGLVQVHDDRDAIQTSPADLPAIDIRSPW